MRNVERRGRGRSRRRTYLYALIGLTIVCALIYWEQTALLYVVSTLVVCALLLIVAFADLEGKDRELFAAREAKGSEPGAKGKFATTEFPHDENTIEVVTR